jgi:hypothetical protein
MFRYSRFVGDELETAELDPRLYAGQTFATPDDAAAFIRRLLAD